MLVFRDGKLKPGGEREESGRPKKRAHQTTLVQGNHYLLNTFFEAESIEQEDGEMTGSEVPQAVLVQYFVHATVTLSCPWVDIASYSLEQN